MALFLGLANLALAVVNLLPAFPTSGGRLLRAVALIAGGALMAFSGDRSAVYAGLWLSVAGLIVAVAGVREIRAAR